MSAVNIPFTGQAYKVGAVDCGGTILNGTQNSTVSSGISKQSEFADGTLGPRFTYISTTDPTMDFTTSNLAVLSMTGFRGTSLSQISDTPYIDIYLERLQPNASIFSGAKHLKWRANKGALIPTQLQIPSEGIATVDYTMTITSPPQTWPLEDFDEVTLPALAALSELMFYGLGPMFINGIPIVSKESVSFALNPDIQPQRRDGNIYPECTYVSGYTPQVQVDMGDLSYALSAKLGRAGHAAKTGTGQGTCLYLRRRMAGGEYYPNSETEHIKLSFAGDYSFAQLAGGQSNQMSTTQMTIDLLSSGSASDQEIEITTGVAIPVVIDVDDPEDETTTTP